MKESPISYSLNVVSDREQAMSYLLREEKYAGVERPDIILLDLDLPKKDSLDVLREIKGNPDLKRIPVIILTASNDEENVRSACDLNANCYVIKPINFDKFSKVIESIVDFWFTVVRLPEG